MNRMAWLLVASVLLHGLLGLWLANRWGLLQPLSAPVLTQPIELSFVQPALVEPVPAPATAKPPLSVPVPVPEPQQQLVSTERAPPPAVAESVAPLTSLNLDRGWLREQIHAESQARREANDRVSLETFRPAAAERLQAQQLRNERRVLLAERALARDGAAPEDYQMQHQIGEVLKTEQGCFAQQRSVGLSGMETRWWRTSCAEPRTSVWEQSVLSFDGIEGKRP